MTSARLGATMPTDPVAAAVGDALPEFTTAPITRTQLVRYAGASGDFNPMHHDEPFAARAGMPSVFAHGLLQTGTAATLLTRWLGVQHLRSFATRFTGQVWPDDVLTLSGAIDAIRVDDGTSVADISFTMTRQTGDVIITGRATARVA